MRPYSKERQIGTVAVEGQKNGIPNLLQPVNAVAAKAWDTAGQHRRCEDIHTLRGAHLPKLVQKERM